MLHTVSQHNGHLVENLTTGTTVTVNYMFVPSTIKDHYVSTP